MAVKFTTSQRERDLIAQIVIRAGADDRQSLEMDITACHCNGNPLDLEALLNADDFDFYHDVWGISNFISRQTGRLTEYFFPRYSLPQ